MTTTTDAGLLQAIVSAPYDDTPRLAFADWLDEQGLHDRAEFIRVQVELARMEPHERSWPGPKRTARKEAKAFCDKLNSLGRRERELYATARHEWQGYLIEVIPKGARIDDWVTFTRGFVSHLTCSAADFLRHVDELVATQPIEYVTITDDVPLDERFSPDGFAEWRLRGRDGSRWLSNEEQFYNRDERTIVQILLESEWPTVNFKLSVAV